MKRIRGFIRIKKAAKSSTRLDVDHLLLQEQPKDVDVGN